MRTDQFEAFKALYEDGVFAELFNEVRDDLATQWAKCDNAEQREELWQRQRALRDVTRAFKARGGLDA